MDAKRPTGGFRASLAHPVTSLNHPGYSGLLPKHQSTPGAFYIKLYKISQKLYPNSTFRNNCTHNYVIFHEFSKNRSRSLQSPYKLVGTTLTTFLVYFWTLGRLRRPARRSHRLSSSSHSSRASSGQHPGYPGHRPKSMDFQDFQGFSEIFENHHFYSKNRGCQIGSKTFLTHPGTSWRSPGCWGVVSCA